MKKEKECVCVARKGEGVSMDEEIWVVAEKGFGMRFILLLYIRENLQVW